MFSGYPVQVVKASGQLIYSCSQPARQVMLILTSVGCGPVGPGKDTRMLFSGH
ncbi:hypothetical protein NG821_02240 [Prevotella cerevisiae]|uniref:Uncharacterized protein n=1 Tax=Segatella cerevisiae TaxID=2053716 RepID=A0ABT1BUB3_9BACT|nr:hypothetical protein [Segatella cerevisiae]MCO6024671.1 hypothetical protein [Segatella cerevisiae]